MTDYRDEYTRIRIDQINNRVTDHNKRLDALHRQSVRRADYSTPEERAEAMARVEQLLEERLNRPQRPAVDPVDLRDLDHT
jgi:hypothetical protein